MVSNLEYLPGLGSSDHVILRFTLVCYSPVRSSSMKHRVYTDYQLVTEELSSSNWADLEGLTLEEAYKLFKARVSEAVDKCSKQKNSGSNINYT